MASIKASMHWCVCTWCEETGCLFVEHRFVRNCQKTWRRLLLFCNSDWTSKNEQLYPEPSRKCQKCQCTLICYQITLSMMSGWNLSWLKHQVMERNRVIKRSLCTWLLYCNHQVHKDFLITLYYITVKLAVLADRSKLQPNKILNHKTIPKEQIPQGIIVRCQPKGWIYQWIDEG